MSTPKQTANVDDAVEWNELDFRTLNINNINEFMSDVPMIKLEKMFRDMKFELYEQQHGRLKNINSTQPKWVHPSWTPQFNAIVTDFIKKKMVSP